MKPLSLTLYRFGPFVDEQRFEFPEEPGLYFMQGLNEVEPRLERNGTGKTSLWKALTWVIFGKDASNLKAGDVANWDEPAGAWVNFEFADSDDLVWQVMRQHSPNRWVLFDWEGHEFDLTKDETNRLMSLLRLEFTPFLNTVLMAQGKPMFLDLKAGDKAALFSEVMNLDRWLAASERASKKAKDVDAGVREQEREEASLKGQIESISNEDVTDSSEEWEARRKGQLTQIESEYTETLNDQQLVKEQVSSLEAAANLKADTVESKRRLLDAAEVEVRDRDRLNQADRAAVAELDKEAARLNNQINHLAESKSCPTCGTSGASLAGAIKLAEKALTQTKLAARDRYGVMMGSEQRLDRAEEAHAGAKKGLQEAIEAHREGDRLLSETKRSYDLLDRRLDGLEEKADSLAAESNPYARLQEQAVSSLRKLRTRLDATQQRLAQATERHAMLGFWVRGFKDLRLKQIAESLQQLDIEVNSCVMELGLVEWELKFEVDRETKSGSIERGFSVFVKSPHNKLLVPWEAWSGGEKQRLRLAAQMGLANLIRSSTGATISLEVWDEPTNGMSAQGIDDLLESLSRRAIREQRQIWLVDHRSLGHGGFDGGITVVKDKNGSRFINKV